MIQSIIIIILALFGLAITKTISFDTFYVMLAISLATSGICQEISKLKNKETDDKESNDEKE